MKTGRRRKAAPERKQQRKTIPEPESAAPEDEESCRCKEISRKSIPELLKVAVTDLSFWKKGK